MNKWTVEAVSSALAEAGLQIRETKAIEHATQLVLPEGTKVNVFSSGKAVVQGKQGQEKQLASAVLKSNPYTSYASKPVVLPIKDSATIPASAYITPQAGAIPRQRKDRVFIVYGHDKKCRDELELLLLRLGLKPVILQNLAATGQTIIESLMSNAESDYAIVLLTPDDEGHRADFPTEKRFRARQNVVLELGMFLAKLGRERVAILHKGNIELPSDINGLIYISFTNSVSEAKNKLAATLQKADFYIDIEALSAE